METYKDRENFHRHKCQFCGFVWEHHNMNDIRHGAGGAHECPSCHRCNWSLGIYNGIEAPRVQNGIVPELSSTGVTFPVGNIHADQNHYYGDPNCQCGHSLVEHDLPNLQMKMPCTKCSCQQYHKL